MATTEFTGCTLTEIQVTNRELGRGSYATVLELEYIGLKCAGKKIHEALLSQDGTTSYALHRFEKECCILSKLCHPNIVQFLGVHFQQGVQVPMLVMEFLPTNLTACIQKHGILPAEISYSILHDVALGLLYLHSQIHSIIHRDLSSNNILLTPNMKAKISDLGVAKILNLTPLQISRKTQTPGTPAYMPPEVMVAKPIYGTSIDEFSYGILMIHVLGGKWPEPQVGQTLIDDSGKLIPVSEAERRKIFLQSIGDNHPLMDLILRCIDNNPKLRAPASEIVKQLAGMVYKCPLAINNHLDMLKLVNSLREETEMKSAEIEQKKWEIDQLKVFNSDEAKQLQLQLKGLNDEKFRLSCEIEQLKLQAEDLNTETTLQKGVLQGEIAELNTIISAKDLEISAANSMKEAAISKRDSEISKKTEALKCKDATISKLSEQLSRARECLGAKLKVSMHI